VKDLEDKVLTLESQVGDIENENRVLQQKLENTTVTLSTYVRDMNSVLESHEITNILNMDVESEEDEFFEDEEYGAGGAHP
jgi:hypothetical protein